MLLHYFLPVFLFCCTGSVRCSDNIVFPDQIASRRNTEAGVKFNADDPDRFHRTNTVGGNTYNAGIDGSNSWRNEQSRGVGHHQQPNEGGYRSPDSWPLPGTPRKMKPGFPELPGFPEFPSSGNSQSNANAESNSQASNGRATSNAQAHAQSQGPNGPSNIGPYPGFPNYSQQANAGGSSQASDGFASSNSNSNSQTLGFGGGAASASSAASATTGIVNGRPVAAAAASAAAASAGGIGVAGTVSVSSSSASSSGNYDKSPWFYRNRSAADDANDAPLTDTQDKIIFPN
ncbi:protein abrupt-like [Diachasmimorpha longicaudata]|uniref:protein abrupt-like n=1 Tax=Diachasmimorpha longicaudata TaxID=58733 RepID=UPI0030B8F6B0